MKLLNSVLTLALVVLCSSCWTITTVAPTPRPVAYTPAPTYVSAPVYTTVTTVKKTSYQPVTTTTYVNSYYQDPSFGLDLRAVAAAFCESRNIQEFEMILNSSKYMISNLDLNGDGWVDYLRVMEVLNGYVHVLVIQDVLAMNVFQDVATVVVDCNGYVSNVQVIGDPYIYGNRYIVEPVFVTRPIMYAHNHGKAYTCWRSPYYWNYYPSHYTHPAPIHYSHYNAYVDNYMHNHKYCHECHYPTQYHYADYDRVRKDVSRNDYAQQNPDKSFSRRNASVVYTPDGKTTAQNVSNASDLRRAAAGSTRTSTSTTSTASQSNTSTRTPANTTTTTTTTTRTPANSTTTTTTTTRTPANTTATTTSSTTTRTSSSTSASTPSNVGSTTSTRTSSSAQSANTGTQTSTTTRSGAQATSTRTNVSTPITTTPSATTTTRMSTSGTSRTTTRTTNADGTTTTVKRATTSTPTSTSTRSAASTSTSTRTSSSSTTTRTTSSSTSTRR